NLLIIRFTGRIDPSQTRSQAEKVKAKLVDLQPGFRLLADLTDLEFMDVTCAPDIERTMDLCDVKGVSKVVRVIPDPSKDIGLNIMSVFHYRPSVRIVSCKTM